jgi:hypothetical protein
MLTPFAPTINWESLAKSLQKHYTECGGWITFLPICDFALAQHAMPQPSPTLAAWSRKLAMGVSPETSFEDGSPLPSLVRPI